MPTYNLSMSCVDDYNGKYNRRFQLDALDHVTAMSLVALFITSYQGLSDGAVLKYTVGEEVIVSETPTAEANKDEGLTFTLDLGGGKSAPLKMPAPDKASVQSDRSVDLTDPAVSAWLDHFIGGPFFISDGETAVGAIKGVLDK